MNEFRRRVLIPLLVPVVAIGVILFAVLDFSRALLALAGAGATIVAGVTAVAVLIGATRLSLRSGPRSAGGLALMAGVALVLVAVGLLAQARLDEEQSEAARATPARTQAGPADVTVVAFDIGFRQRALTARAGSLRIAYVDEGRLVHTLVFQGVPRFGRLEVGGLGDRVVGEADFAPGTYVFYCDIPGHRQAGMEGVLTVS
jgi:plastocyanin